MIVEVKGIPGRILKSVKSENISKKERTFLKQKYSAINIYF